MSGQSNIKQALNHFQAEQAAVITLAFVDLTARMVLISTSKRVQAQEILDRLAEEAARLFEDPSARQLNAMLGCSEDISECWQSDKQGTRLFVSGPPGSGEALVFVLARSADRRFFAAEAVRLGRQVWADQ